VTHASTLTNSKRNFLEADSSNQTNSKDSLGVDSPDHTNSGGVPHVRTSVRGFRNTGRSPIKGLSFLPDKADDKGRTGGRREGAWVNRNGWPSRRPWDPGSAARVF
jgi:hypothetical protein